MEKCYNKEKLKKEKNVTFRNSFVTPLLSVLSELFDSNVILKFEDQFEGLKSQEILALLGLSEKDYEGVLNYIFLKNIDHGVSEIGAVSLEPFLMKNIFEKFDLSGTIYVRANDLDGALNDEFLESFKGKVRLGIYVDPYSDGDELTNFVSNYSAKKELPVVIRLYDNLERTGELNTTYNLTPIQYVESVGLLDRQTKILGGVCADKEDFEVMSMYGTKMIICPYESLNLGFGCPNLYAMQNSGVEVEIASPFQNCLKKEVEFVSVVSRGMLNDETILCKEDVFDLVTSKEKQPRFDSGELLILQSKIQKILEKIKEKFNYADC